MNFKQKSIFVTLLTISTYLSMFTLLLCVGCSEDVETPFDISEKAPVISIKALSSEISFNDGEIHATFKLVADPAPQKDLVVLIDFYIGDFWTDYYDASDSGCVGGKTSLKGVSIPKGKKESNAITYSERYIFLFGDGHGERTSLSVRVIPLPVIDVVGEGTVVDNDRLLSYFDGRKTYDGKHIPEAYMFPYYEPAQTDYTVIYRAEDVDEVCEPVESVNPF